MTLSFSTFFLFTLLFFVASSQKTNADIERLCAKDALTEEVTKLWSIIDSVNSGSPDSDVIVQAFLNTSTADGKFEWRVTGKFNRTVTVEDSSSLQSVFNEDSDLTLVKKVSQVGLQSITTFSRDSGGRTVLSGTAAHYEFFIDSNNNNNRRLINLFDDVKESITSDDFNMINTDNGIVFESVDTNLLQIT